MNCSFVLKALNFFSGVNFKWLIFAFPVFRGGEPRGFTNVRFRMALLMDWVCVEDDGIGSDASRLKRLLPRFSLGRFCLIEINLFRSLFIFDKIDIRSFSNCCMNILVASLVSFVFAACNDIERFGLVGDGPFGGLCG